MVRTLHDDLREPEEDDVIMCNVELRERTQRSLSEIQRTSDARGKMNKTLFYSIVRTVMRMHVVVKLHRVV